MAWYMGPDGFPTNGTAPAPDKFTKPYPKSYWRIEAGYNNGFPFHELLPDIPHTSGAFYQAKDLSRVHIPDTVKIIGDEAFKGTALKRVTIAADCEYNAETSFPPDCVVRRYPDSNYAQLYDCDGKAVLDSRGARIYVKKEK